MVPYKVSMELHKILGTKGWRRVALSILDHAEFKLWCRRMRKQGEVYDKIRAKADPNAKGKYLYVKLPKIKEEKQ